MAQAVVQVRDLTKVFAGCVAVDRVSFEIYEGEILGLLGPNGAGKTTIIQMLLDLVTPTSGDITIFGLDVRRHRESVLTRVNFSSAYLSLPASLTAEESLTVYARLYGVRNYREKISELLSLFEITDVRPRVTKHLSSGQLTRLNLAKALINDPRLLLLDEPTASLDPDIADKTRRLLKGIRDQKGLTILYTSHNMKEMEEISDRIIFLRKGKIVASGPPAEILRDFKEEDLERVFLKIAREQGGFV